MNFSVTKNGKALAKSLYTWDEKTRTFSTNESGLVLDFNGIDGCTFKTGYGCTFDTGSNCTFNTGWNCTFNTGWNCTFKTGYGCTFDTGYDCTFKTGDDCTFKTGYDCTFKTGDDCTFKTGSDCTFHTGEKCSLTYTWNDCFEVYKLPVNKEVKILLNGQLEDVIQKPVTKKIELDLTEEQIQSLIKQGFVIK